MKKTLLTLTEAGAFIRVGAATLGVAIVAASSSASSAVQIGTVPVRVQQAQTLVAPSQLGATPQIPPICRDPLARRPITRDGLREFGLLLAQCAALRVPSAAIRKFARSVVGPVTWTESIPWTFTGNADGLYPQTTLLRDANGALIGENDGCNTSAACYNGIVFKLIPPAPGKTAWTETDLYGFPSTNPALGISPEGGLVMDRRGALYGTTQTGGTGCGVYGCGIVFKLTPPAAGQTAWTETVLHMFTGVNGDGAEPEAGVVIDERGILYGTTFQGGNTTSALCAKEAPFPGCGTVFALTPPPAGKTTWTESVLHTFTGVNGDGSLPELSGVVFDDCGNLYGTAHFGGGVGLGAGIVYKLTRPGYGRAGWTETILHAFSGGLDGNGPVGGLTLYRGAVYGTASGGGANGVTNGGDGIAFRLTPRSASWQANWDGNWTETVLHNFGTGPDDGADPSTALIVDDDALYGTTLKGGASGYGTVFKLSPPMSGQTAWTDSVLHSFSGSEFADGYYDGNYPLAPLTAGGHGVLFGTTEFGGSAFGPGPVGYGVVFELKE